MNCLLAGKILETIGSGLVAWVAAQACYLEVKVDAPLRMDEDHPENGDTDLARLRKSLERISERRRRQFGYWELISVCAGTIAIFAGCAFYLFGLVSEPR